MNIDLSSFWDLPQATQVALLGFALSGLVMLGTTLKLLGTLVKNRRSAVTLALMTSTGVYMFGWVLPAEVSAEIGAFAASCVARPFAIARDWDMQDNTLRTKVLVELAGYALLNAALLCSACVLLSRSTLAYLLATILGVSIAAAAATLGLLAQLAVVSFG